MKGICGKNNYCNGKGGTGESNLHYFSFVCYPTKLYYQQASSNIKQILQSPFKYSCIWLKRSTVAKQLLWCTNQFETSTILPPPASQGVPWQGSYRSWKPGKSWNFRIWFSRPGKSWKLSIGHGKSWKMKFYKGHVQNRFSRCFFCDWKLQEEKINES